MRIDVLGVGFDNVTMDEAVEQGMALLRGDGPHYVVTPNPEIVELSRNWSEVAQAINGADLVLPDGIGIIKGAKILGTPLKERTPGIEFAEHLMERMAEEGLSLYLLGAKSFVVEQAARKLMTRFPGLRIAGYHDGYFRDNAPVVEEIRKSGADVVFVCMGAPRQELWMVRNGPATGARLLCGLGGSLDIFSGVSRRAPKFFRNHGLEWFYRLCQEPSRLNRMMKLPAFLRHVWRRRRELVREQKKIQKEQRLIQKLEAKEARQEERRLERERRKQQKLAEKEARQAAKAAKAEPAEKPDTAEKTNQTGGNSPVRESVEAPMSDYTNKDTTNWNAEEVRQARERNLRRRRKRRRSWLRVPLYLLLVIIVSVLLAECGWLLFSDLCAFNREGEKTATIEITTGDDIQTVAEKLHDAGLIQYKFFFRIFAALANAEDKIGAGTYELNTAMDYRALIVGMHNSSGSMKSDTVDVTIPEGYSVRDIINLLAQKGVATEDELWEAARTAVFNYPFIDNESQDASRLEGYLFPDTYNFYKPERPESALNRLLSNFNRKLNGWEEGLSYAETRNYDLKDVVTVASLIEKETDGTDQARIASVIHNRMYGPGDKRGTYGFLQIDASLLYALPGHAGPITSADLELDSPYNLYRNTGLPPTPIANPGAKAIEAVLTPEDTDYYYYGLAKDGKHRFFSNYSSFTAFLASPDYIGN